MHFCFVNFKSWLLGGYIFSGFLLVGTLNWDLSQMLFGQKFPKAAIVRLAMSTRSSVSWLDSSKTSLLQSLFLKIESKAIENKNQILKFKGLLEVWFLVTSQLFCFVIVEWAAWPCRFEVGPLTIFPTRSLLFPTLALSSHQQIVLLLDDRKSNCVEKWTYGYRYVFDE